jgi:hypothetical protein
MVSVKEIASFKNFGKCLEISNGRLVLYVTIDIGPRIIYCSLDGSPNLMLEDVERKNQKDVSSLFGADKYWYIYGGHRLWFIPEEYPKTYYPDNEKVVYTVTETGCILTPPTQLVTGLKYTITISVHPEEPVVTINHVTTNTSSEEVKGASWALTAMRSGGTTIVPQTTTDTVLLPNRSIVFWPYTDINDYRLKLGNKYVVISQDPANSNPIKLGFTNTIGKVVYVNGSVACSVSYGTSYGEDNEYPDFGSSCEVYECDYFTEVETLSPIRILSEGASISHTEKWKFASGVNLTSTDDASLDGLFKIV